MGEVGPKTPNGARGRAKLSACHSGEFQDDQLSTEIILPDQQRFRPDNLTRTCRVLFSLEKESKGDDRSCVGKFLLSAGSALLNVRSLHQEMTTSPRPSYWNQSFPIMMAYLLPYLLVFSSVISHRLASPAHVQGRVIAVSNDSTLILGGSISLSLPFPSLANQSTDIPGAAVSWQVATSSLTEKIARLSSTFLGAGTGSLAPYSMTLALSSNTAGFTSISEAATSFSAGPSSTLTLGDSTGNVKPYPTTLASILAIGSIIGPISGLHYVDYSGSFSALLTVPIDSFPFFLDSSVTVSEAAVIPEAALLGGLSDSA